MTQTEHSRANRAAWSHRAYEAWQHGYGSPPEAAASIREDPEIILREYREHLGDVRGKVVANLLGSHGRRAVALAILGAEVTVVDISAENQRYALELARAAGVTIEYIVSDILEWKTESLADHFDTVLMEYGILHYFVQLDPLVRLLEKILKPAGKVVLHEFHPIDKKCGLIEEGGRLILQGDYFSRQITEKPLPHQGSFSAEEVESFPLCRVRYWQLGEVVTAIAVNGLHVEKLLEQPHMEYSTLPGTFTLVATKAV